MTTAALEGPGRSARVWRVVRSALSGTLSAAHARVRPVVGHVVEHFYSLAGLGCISAAGFVHSTFTGLLVTGLMFLVFEWKVSE
jgi:hypothetical protein